jgi:type I restriction-modification system DNA methylase subunit
MASKSRNKAANSVHSKTTFSESILSISQRFSLFTAFDDFLTMTMAACTQNLETKKSWYEDEYLATIAKYKDSELRHEFPKAFASLVNEMEERVLSSQGNDVLGEFFEQHISNGRNSQFFTPFPVCQFMAGVVHNEVEHTKPKRIIDPTCGSGRMLLAASKVHGQGNEYYGIDVDRTCVKMTALNLFLHGVFNSEILCADALKPEDFVIAYRISFIPLGIFKIENKEESKLWHLHNSSFTGKREKISDKIILDSTPFEERKKDDSTQLNLF